MNTKYSKIYWPIVILLLIQTIVSSEIFWILGALICFYKIIHYKGSIFLPFKEYKILILFVFWGMIIGLLSYLTSSVNLIDLIRDLFYYLSPIIFIYLGVIWMREGVNIYSILNAFIVFSGIISLISLFNVVQNINELLTSSYVGDWRDKVGNGDTTLAVTLAVILSGVIPKDYRINKHLYGFISILTGLYFILTLSRTVLLAIIIIFLCLVIKKHNTKTIKKVLFGGVIACITFFMLLFLLPKTITAQFIEKLASSWSEISFNHTWSSVAEIQSNWRGYESYCALYQWSEYNIFNKIFGAGFGERIYVGEYAYLFLNQVDSSGRPIDTIAVLHNGYATQIVKLGIAGVILYVLFYILIIRKGIKANHEKDTLESRLLIGVGIELLLQTYFLNGLFKDTCFFALVVLIGYAGHKCSSYHYNYVDNVKKLLKNNLI